AALRERHEALGERPQPLRLRLRRRDPAVLEERRRQVAEDQPLVRRTAAEPRTFRWRGHSSLLSLRRTRLELLVFGEALTFVLVVDSVVGDQARVEPGRAVLQRETHAVQLGLDLVDRLLPEVADVEQIGLAAADELADRVDA